MRHLFLAPLGAMFALAAHAQNDECTGATPVTAGTYPFDTTAATLSAPIWPCAFQPGPDLWYRFAATTNDILTISLCGSSYDSALEVLTGTCAGLVRLSCNNDACGLQSELVVPLESGTTYFIRIGGHVGSAGTGSLTLSLSAPPFPEDVCVGALPLGSGMTAFSTLGATTSEPSWSCVGGGSDLWYRFTAAGTNVDIDTFRSNYDSTLEAFSGACGSLSSLACNDDAGGTIQSFISVPTIPGQSYYLRVGGFGGFTGVGLLEVVGAGAPPGGAVGTNYCTANTNSTGQTGRMTGTGSAVVADNDLTLEADRLPASSFGFFLTSTTQAFTPNPGGSAGNLCLGSQIGRYVGPGQIKNSGATGAFSLLLNLAQTPTPTGSVAVLAGQSRNFQAWHRDFVGGAAVSNFTDGLGVTFQ